MSFEHKLVALSAATVEQILLAIEGIDPTRCGLQLDQAGPYGVQEVRQAIAQKAMECVQSRKSSGLCAQIYRGEKQLAEGGKASLLVTYPQGDRYIPETVQLSVLKEEKPFLEFEFPTREPQTAVRCLFIKYVDFRHHPPKATFLSDMRAGATPEQIQHMLEGMRWMAANLRRWKDLPDRVILPEDV